MSEFSDAGLCLIFLIQILVNKLFYRWICRVLNWIPDFGRRNAQGRLQQSWDDKLGAYCRWRGLGTWNDTARNSLAWMQRMDDFVQFVIM